MPAAALAPASNKNGLLVILLGLYALLLTVPIAEILARLGARTLAPLIVGAILLLGVLTTGKLADFWALPVARPYMLFLILAFVAGVTGYYPSRSLELLLPYTLRFHLLPFLCCAIAPTTRQVKHVYSWIGLGALILLLLCMRFGEMADDRLIIRGSSLENPNDLGFAIVFAMAGLIVFRSVLGRVVSIVTLPVFLFYVLKTGSRADLVTLVGLALIAGFFAPGKWRIIVLVGLPIAGGALMAAVPGETRARLLSVFSDSSSNASSEVSRAGDSKAARAELQVRAMELAIRHPLFGVGVTNFQDAIEDMIQATLHTKSGWQVAHNTYLQIAAENGLPAFICYVWCLIICLKMNIRSYRICLKTPQLAHATAQSFGLMMMTAMFMICTAFSNNSFDPHFTLLVGLSAANCIAVRRESMTPQEGGVSSRTILPPTPKPWERARRPGSFFPRASTLPVRIGGRRL
jgi:hypothetical protein